MWLFIKRKQGKEIYGVSSIMLVKYSTNGSKNILIFKHIQLMVDKHNCSGKSMISGQL